MSKYLYGASVQGIQEYVFETNELKSIIGASEIIKSLNRKIAKEFPENIIINAAGNIKLLFEENEKSKLEKQVENFLKDTKQNAFGIVVSQAVVKFEEGGLKNAFNELEKRLAIQRNKETIPVDNSINIIKLAPKSGKPEVMSKKDKSSLQKEDANPNGGRMPKNKKNKTAIIHADGNGLGAKIAAMIKNLNSDDEVIKAYKNFSKNLDKATTEAFDEAKRNYKNIRDVILGGDDMTVVCNANDALEFTSKFLAEFEEKTKIYLKEDGLTACAGIAFCNHKYPFHYAISLAESLCSHAKKHSRDINENFSPSSIMFHNIQSSNFDSYDEYIKTELTLGKEKVRLDYGPYFLQEQDEYATVENFKQLTEAFKIKNSPLSRYRAWLTILSQDFEQAKERLERIADIIELKDDVFDKKKFVAKLANFRSDMKLRKMLFDRTSVEDKKSRLYTPIYDITSYLSVIDYEKIEQGVEDED